MTLSKALRAGWRGMIRERRGIVLAWVASVLLALPLAAAVQVELASSFGNSIAADTMRTGFDDLWHRGFAARAQGLAATFDASVAGIGAVLGPIERLARGDLLALPAPLVAAGLAYWLVWVFLAGGFVARLCDDRRGLLAAAASCFARVLALATCSAVACVMLLRATLDLGESVVERATLDVVDERVVLAWVLGKYAFAWSCVALSSAVFEQARVAAVAEPGRSLRSAVRVGLLAVVRAPGRMLGLACALLAGLAALVAAYGAIAPGIRQHDWQTVALAFAISQTSVVARIAIRVIGLGAHTALQRSRRQ
jgi:hypothetical protein